MSGWRNYNAGGSAAEGRKLGLLIVDDEERILESLTELLQDSFDVHAASRPEDALDLFKEKRPELVLCDQRMPGVTGIELLKQMRDLEPGTMRFLLTGYSDIDVVIEALNEQILAKYITKPWVNEELVQVLSEGAARYLRENGLVGEGPEILF